MHDTWRTCCLGLALMLAWALPAHAAGHALLMLIGDYAEPTAKLRGIEHDARMAEDMARRMGVAPGNIIWLKNRQATHEGMRQAWAILAARVKPGDMVFAYFSGHGGQLGAGGQQGCSEGLATWDNRVYFDAQLRQHLDTLARVAAQVIMFNDSCFSGGAVTKSLRPLSPGESPDEVQIKAYPGLLLPPADAAPEPPGQAKGGTVAEGAVAVGVTCGVADNVGKQLGSAARALRAKGAEVFYMAASAANQAAFGTAQGSVATRAWAACLAGKASISGQALAACAQQWITAQPARYQQTITPLLDKGMTIRLPGSP